MGFGVIADSPEGIHSRTHQIHHGTGLFGGAAGLFSGLNCRSQPCLKDALDIRS